MENEKKYETPSVEVITFADEDIIRTSGFGNAYDPTIGDLGKWTI